MLLPEQFDIYINGYLYTLPW